MRAINEDCLWDRVRGFRVTNRSCAHGPDSDRLHNSKSIEIGLCRRKISGIDSVKENALRSLEDCPV